ncbi:putative HVA22-like protein g isoform X1 [Typha latifolia]|uniref:putative HVA22-like protein g isoform X1 n=1 Tax=Typha latifolia TaxID=4733 RepID=UPI003C2D3695
MIGGFLTRYLVLVLGYAYPAYECYKTVELNKPEIEQLIFWCQYWILVAMVTVLERFGDAFISWLPMYNEAKLAFLVYMWYPKTKGTTYVYETFFRPYVAKHENEIDRNLLELRARAGDIVIHYWQKVASYGQTIIFEILQYIASQSPSQSTRSRPVQQQQQSQKIRRTSSTVTTQQPAVSQHLQPPPSESSGPKIQRQESVKAGPSTRLIHLQEPTKLVAPGDQPTTSAGLPNSQPVVLPTPTATIEGEMVHVSVTTTADKEDPKPPRQEIPVEEAIRLTRNRMRKRAGTIAPPSS